MMRFANWPYLLLIPVLLYLFSGKRKKAALNFSSISVIRAAGLKETIKGKIGRYIILAGLILFCIALARPQLLDQSLPLKREGIDIVLVLDVSGSMRSVDFEPSRLEAARETMDKFIQQRNQDRISLVIFAGTAYTRIPLTLDHNILRASLQEVDVTSVNQDGTAIGMGISVALNRLKKSEAESKVVVLVTDGVNNAGSIDPLTAARLASEMGVRIYTIGVGTDETIMPVYIMGQKRYQRYAGGLDEELLREIAETTGGKYYRARDPKALDNIFKEINRLEKTSFERDNFQQYRELAYPLILAGLFLILIGLFLDRYYYIRIP